MCILHFWFNEMYEDLIKNYIRDAKVGDESQ